MVGQEEWGIRSFLAPVITRMLIYGTNPFDIEACLQDVESINILNSNMLQDKWMEFWENKAERYREIAEKAVENGNRFTAYEMYQQAAQCYYSIFLINFVNLEIKKKVYLEYVKYYQKALFYMDTESKRVEIPYDSENKLPAYLHIPQGDGPFACTILFAGLGSCKEEMDILAQPLIKRGVAVLIPDLPGSGESLYDKDIKCRMANLKKAFTCIVDYAISLDTIDSNKIGAAGLCMGGGYAYKATSLDTRLRFCANLFPLFINQVEDNVTPGWMKQGPAYNFQTGGANLEEFLAEMGLEDHEKVDVPYYLIHGKHDNWMTIESAMKLYENTTGKKELLVIDDDPVYYQGIKVTHTMPVGEQLHWVKNIYADWIKEQTLSL